MRTCFLFEWESFSEICSHIVLCRTQIPHAVGAAYSLKMDGKKACTITYFGDGGTSEVLEQVHLNRLNSLHNQYLLMVRFLRREISMLL